jgi:hypothetical protein
MIMKNADRKTRLRDHGLPIMAKSLALAGVLLLIPVIGRAEERPAAAQPPDAANFLYVKVQLENPIKLSKLKPGDVVEGNLSRDVYSADRELFPAGSHVRVVVDHMEKRRRIRNDHWPWVVNAFTPRHQPYPVFKSAMVSGVGGETGLQVSLISVSRMHDVHAQAKKSGQAVNGIAPVEVGPVNKAKNAAPVMIFEASTTEASEIGKNAVPNGNESEWSSNLAEVTLPAGTGCRILLLGDVSASKSQPGDPVRARVLEPVLYNNRVVLPVGTLIDGKVVKKTPPRWASRAGSLYLTFTGLTLPGGNRVPITASLAAAELERRSHTKIDPEGQLHGEHPGKAWMAINIGVTAGLAKEADDTLQLIIEAIVSTATDASTAGSGRIAASIVSGIYMVSRHGRDVILPRFTELGITLDRPLPITKAARVEALKETSGN